MLNFKHSSIVFLFGFMVLPMIDSRMGAILFVVIWIVCYVAIVAYGVVHLKASFFLTVLWKGNVSENRIALTFDDGPHKDITLKVLQLLEKHNIKATFFCIGSHIAGNETVLQSIHKQGHSIGNHSFSHSVRFDVKSTDGVMDDIEKTEQSISSVIGKRTRLFRPPFGVTNPNIAQALTKLDYETIGWSIRTFDAVSDNKHRIINKVKKQLQNGSVILLHDVNEYVLDMLDEIIVLAKNRGYEFVTVDKLFSIEAYGIE